MKALAPGLFVVIEGGDACGKHTQSKRLVNRLAKQHAGRGCDSPPKLFSFPRYETPLGHLIEAHLKREVELVENSDSFRSRSSMDSLAFQCFMQTDQQHAHSEICALLESDRTHVVSDRWWPSGVVYGGADGLDTGWIAELGQQRRTANLYILLDVPAEEAMKRRPPRDRYEEKLEFRTEIRKSYLTLWEAQYQKTDNGWWSVIDGLLSPEEVHRQIWDIVQALLTVQYRVSTYQRGPHGAPVCAYHSDRQYIKRSELFDSYYCNECQVWLETACPGRTDVPLVPNSLLGAPYNKL